MSITDELRKWAARELASWKMARERYDALTAIADRIDAAVEGMVELPKDADGEYISVGDVMEWVRYKDDDQTIMRTVSGIGNGVFFAWSDEQGRYAQYEAHAYRHYHAPTVEDLLREVIDKATNSTYTIGDILSEYAAKLRLAGDAE